MARAESLPERLQELQRRECAEAREAEEAREAADDLAQVPEAMADGDVGGGTEEGAEGVEAWPPPHEPRTDSPQLQRRMARAERLLFDNCPDYRKYKELQRTDSAEAREAEEAREAADGDVDGSDSSGSSGAEGMSDSEVGGSSDGWMSIEKGAEGAEAMAESEIGGRVPFGQARKEQSAYFAAAAAGDASAADKEQARKRQKTHGPMVGVDVENAVVARTGLTLAQVQSVYRETQQVVIGEMAYKQQVIIPDLVVLYHKDQPATHQRDMKVFGKKRTIAAKPAKKEVLAIACKVIRECVCSTCGHPKLMQCHSHC
jgi:hypothetical protein